MIRADELRIGNYIFLPDQITHQIKEGSELDSIRLYEGRDYYKGIPLTEEWLLKFGFTYSEALMLYKLKESNTIFEYDEDIEDSCYYGIHFFHNGDHVIVESTNEHGEYSNLKFQHIKYVHQLQNLYFALTGKELEVKP